MLAKIYLEREREREREPHTRYRKSVKFRRVEGILKMAMQSRKNYIVSGVR